MKHGWNSSCWKRKKIIGWKVLTTCIFLCFVFVYLSSSHLKTFPLSNSAGFNLLINAQTTALYRTSFEWVFLHNPAIGTVEEPTLSTPSKVAVLRFNFAYFSKASQTVPAHTAHHERQPKVQWKKWLISMDSSSDNKLIFLCECPSFPIEMQLKQYWHWQKEWLFVKQTTLDHATKWERLQAHPCVCWNHASPATNNVFI